MSVHDRIVSLKTKHAALEMAIENESRRPLPDSDQLRSLKWQKLRIKDELSSIDPVLRH